MKLKLFFVRKSVSIGASLWQLVINPRTPVPDDEKIDKAAKEHFGSRSGIHRKLDDRRIVLSVSKEFCPQTEANFLAALAES